MTDPSARKIDPAGAEAETATEQQASAAAAAGADSAPAPEQPDPLAEAKREAAEFRDKLLRTLAEMENLRKRTEREVAEARLYGVAGFARDVLAVADNIHRALEAVGPEQRAQADAKMKALIEGVELTERELLKALEKNGVKKFTPAGEKFDPNVHQAMFEMEHPEVPPGHVAQVMQAGYMLGERVLRPAMVGVAKAGPKPQPKDNEPQESAAGNPQAG